MDVYYYNYDTHTGYYLGFMSFSFGHLFFSKHNIMLSIGDTGINLKVSMGRSNFRSRVRIHFSSSQR